MDPIATFSGLATGIDFRTLVDEIIRAESRPVTMAQTRIAELERRSAAWDDFRSRVKSVDDLVKGLADGTAFDTHITSVTGQGLKATASASASPGSYEVEVLQLATNEKLGSDVFASRSDALGLSGEFVVGGRTVSVATSDSLDDIARILNAANSGLSRSGATASVIQVGADQFKLVLNSDQSGSEGIDLADGPDGLLRSLGFLDDTVAIKHTTSDGAMSGIFGDKTSDVATLLSLLGPPAAGAVTIGTTLVTLDLSTMSLADIAQQIEDAATAQGTNISASVLEEVAEDGSSTFRLDISGTTSFADNNRILETLGVLAGGRGAVAQEVQGNAFTDGDAVTTATGATQLSDLFLGGSSAGVQVGDSLSITGTRGDGSTFITTFTVGAGDTLQDLVDDLNSAVDGFKAGGGRTATASISADGRLMVTDDTTGESRLGLSIVANNEGGGALDLGDFDVTAAGRSRQITAGQDAQLLVDGAYVEQSSNTVTDVIKGVTLELSEVSGSPVSIDVALNVGGVVTAVGDLVDAFNAITDFVSDQASGAGAEEGTLERPLAGDSVLRDMRASIRRALESTIDAAVGGSYQRLGDLGIEVNKEGKYDFDKSAFTDAMNADPLAVERLLGTFGEANVSTLKYVSSGDGTQSGTHAVEITQAATQAAITAAGFGGTYVDDGTPDTLTIRDLGSNYAYYVSLSNGMSLSDIIDALNTEFATRTTHEIQANAAVYGDAIGTVATDTTLLADLHDAGGTNMGVAEGDTLTISGTQSDGGSFFHEITLTDVQAAGMTLGDLRAEIQDQVGTDVSVSIQNGQLTVTRDEPGASQLTLSVSSDNLGGGTLSFGALDVTTTGRGVSSIVASDDGGQLRLTHEDYGSLAGFEVSYTAGGTDGTASLGLAANTYAGLDVQGTIGGLSATGSGQLLSADDDTALEGLVVQYTGATTGSIGDMTFSRGIAALVQQATDVILGTEAGSIDSVIERLDARVEAQDSRIELMETRLERRRAMLVRRFSRLEEVMARAQNQQAWLASCLGSLPEVSTAAHQPTGG